MGTARDLIRDWRDMAGVDSYFSASRVQDRLFDLYGEVADEGAKRLLENWLSLTVQRDLFSAHEVTGLLDELEERLGQGVPS